MSGQVRSGQVRSGQVRHFSDGNQTMCPTLKKLIMAPIMPEQRELCL
jgi:hypothetical protein